MHRAGDARINGATATVTVALALALVLVLVVWDWVQGSDWMCGVWSRADTVGDHWSRRGRAARHDRWQTGLSILLSHARNRSPPAAGQVASTSLVLLRCF